MSSKVQHLDWLTTKSDGSIDELKSDLEELKRLRESSVDNNNSGGGGGGSSSELDVSDKLNALAVLITSTRSAIHRVEKDITVIGQNMSLLVGGNR